MASQSGGVTAPKPSSRRKKPRLGKGLSSLIGNSPVSVEPKAAVPKPALDAQGIGAPAPAPHAAGQPSTPAPDRDRVIEMIRLEQIHANPQQPRRVFDDTKLRELAASIETAGVMQPIVVRPARRSGSGGGCGV